MRGSILLLALALTALCCAGQAGTKGDFAARYASMDGKVLRKDVKGVARFLRTDYVYQRSNGQSLRRAEYLQRTVNLLERLSRPQVSDTLDSVRFDGATARVNFHHVIAGNILAPDQRKHAWKQILAGTDIWRRSGSEWLLKRTVIHAASMFMDGKPTAGFGRGSPPAPAQIAPIAR